MNKGKIGVIVATLILLTAVFFYFYNANELYGNDRDSIVEVIKSIEGYEEHHIEILEIKDFGETRIVGFLSNSNPSYIEFQKNSRGNYKWKHVTSRNDSFVSYLPSTNESQMMFITNNNNKIAKMQVDVNGTTIEQRFNSHEASVTWVELPQTNKGSYEFRNYKYYDKSENVIKEH